MRRAMKRNLYRPARCPRNQRRKRVPSPTGEHARQARAAKRTAPRRFDLLGAKRTNDRFGFVEPRCSVENRRGMRGGAIELGFGETRIAITNLASSACDLFAAEAFGGGGFEHTLDGAS